MAVIEYHADRKLWEVMSLDGLKRTFLLPKLFLMMKAEDPVNFSHRIAEAIALRKKSEQLIRSEIHDATVY